MGVGVGVGVHSCYAFFCLLPSLPYQTDEEVTDKHFEVEIGSWYSVSNSP